MPFTRPNASQIVTTTFSVSDPLVEINKDAAGANTNDLGILINRGASGDNVGIIWDRSEQSFALVSTTADGNSTGDITLSAYADLQLRDVTATSLSAGTIATSTYTFPVTDGIDGQVLTTDGAGVVAFEDIPDLRVFKNSYTSAPQAIVSGGLVQLAHGLPSLPTLVQLRLQCVVAEASFAPGEEVVINPLPSVSNSKGCVIYPDSTNINIRFGSHSAVWALPDKLSGAITTLSNSNWNIIVKAWSE